MIAAIHRFMGNAGFFEHFTKFGVDAGVLAFPEGAERIFVGIAGLYGLLARKGEMRGILHQVDIAIGATGEAGAVFGVALRAEHDVPKSTTDGEPV